MEYPKIRLNWIIKSRSTVRDEGGVIENAGSMLVLRQEKKRVDCTKSFFLFQVYIYVLFCIILQEPDLTDRRMLEFFHTSLIRLPICGYSSLAIRLKYNRQFLKMFSTFK